MLYMFIQAHIPCYMAQTIQNIIPLMIQLPFCLLTSDYKAVQYHEIQINAIYMQFFVGGLSLSRCPLVKSI